MGSLTSRPKVPQQQPQIVYVPSAPPPSSDAQVQPRPVVQEGAVPTAEKTAEEREAESRTQNLLARDRGRFGTVNTSFRGLLGLATSGAGQSKTLLGE